MTGDDVMALLEREFGGRKVWDDASGVEVVQPADLVTPRVAAAFLRSKNVWGWDVYWDAWNRTLGVRKAAP